MHASPAGPILRLLAAAVLTACAAPQPEHASAAPAATPSLRPAAVAPSLAARPRVTAGSSPARTGAARYPASAAAVSRQRAEQTVVAVLTPAGPRQAASPVASGPAVTPSAPAGPAILSAAAQPTVVHEGQTVTWEVHTTRDVIAVDAHVRQASFPLQRERPGLFGLALHVPRGVPAMFHGSYSVELTARNASGASVTRTMEMRFE